MTFRRVFSKRRLSEGEHIPRFYGITYHDHTHTQAIAYPIPLNLLVRGYRKLLQWVKIYTPTQRERDLLEAENRGFQQGLVAGETRAIARIHRELCCELQKYLQENRQKE